MVTKSRKRTVLVYGALPLRMISKKQKIMDLAASEKKGCLQPFNALPYKYFEGGVISRKATLGICCRLIDICNEFWIFGISQGTLTEAEYFFKQNKRLSKPKPVRIYIKEFDHQWQKYYKKYKTRFGPTLKRLLLSVP